MLVTAAYSMRHTALLIRSTRNQARCCDAADGCWQRDCDPVCLKDAAGWDTDGDGILRTPMIICTV